ASAVDDALLGRADEAAGPPHRGGVHPAATRPRRPPRLPRPPDAEGEGADRPRDREAPRKRSPAAGRAQTCGTPRARQAPPTPPRRLRGLTRTRPGGT